MGRKMLAVVTAMITAFAAMFITFMIGTMMAPFYPKNLEYMTWPEIQQYIAQLPPSTFVVDLIGFLVASFFAGFISTKMGRRWGGGSTLAFVCGVMLICWELLSVTFWTQPLWFIAASVIFAIPASLIGYKFAHHWGRERLVTASAPPADSGPDSMPARN